MKEWIVLYMRDMKPGQKLAIYKNGEMITVSKLANGQIEQIKGLEDDTKCL